MSGIGRIRVLAVHIDESVEASVIEFDRPRDCGRRLRTPQADVAFSHGGADHEKFG